MKLSRRSLILAAGATALGTLVNPRRSGAAGCDPTTSDILGPYFSDGAPVRTVIARSTEPGQRVVIRGKVVAADCTTPVPGAMIDIWGADASGCYSRFSQGCDPVDDAYNLRGRFLTNAFGEYEFETVKPGKYLNGSQYRPSHIHIKVKPQGATELVSQLYFEGDTSISIDPWASDPAASKRILSMTESEGKLHAAFDIVLSTTASLPLEEDATRSVKLESNYPNPFQQRTTIEYVVPASGLVSLNIFDSTGRHVRTLNESVHARGRYVETWDGLSDTGEQVPPGVFLCKLAAAGSTAVSRIVLTR